MIKNDVEFNQTKLTLEDLEVALADLKQTLAEEDPELFEVFAAPYLKNIDKLRQEIDDYIGVTLAQKKRAPLWLKLQGKGENIEYGKTSAKILSDWLTNVVKAFRNVVTFLYTGKSAEKGAPLKEISTLSEIEVAAFAHGSLEIGFRLPEETQQELFDKRNFPEEALFGLLKAVTWLDSEDPEEKLEEDFPDPAERRVVLDEAMNLVPSEDSPVSTVELTGAYMPRKMKVSLTPKHKGKGKPVIKKLKEHEAVEKEGQIEEYIGWLAEVNYSRYPFTFELHDPDDPKHKKIETFTFEIGLVKKAYEYLDYNEEHPRTVKVRGRRIEKKLEALSIEPLKESE